MSDSKNKFIRIAQGQMGSAHLEVDSAGGLFKSFFGKLIQVFAMTRLPVGSKFRCFLERLRGVKIGKNVNW